MLPPAEEMLRAIRFTIIQSSPDPGQVELIELMAAHRPDALIVRSGVINGPCFDANPNLKCIANHGAGYDDIDIDEATRRGIPVFAAPGRNAIAVAEHVFAMLLAVRKRVIQHDALVRSGGWRPGTPDIAELHGQTLGVIGFGAIGERVAHLARAFGMDVVAYDPVRTRPFPADVTPFATLEEALAASDAVSLHVPLTESTRNMIDETALAQMRPGSILINAARGGVVDEAALVNAIDAGHLIGAGLDTFSVEPPGNATNATTSDRIILSPHIAGVTPESTLRMSMCCAENTVGFVARGETSDDLVNASWFK